MPEDKITGYNLSRDFFNWCFENPELIRPVHIAIYFFAIEHCNRLGWKPKFGFPTQMTMDAIGVKNWRTYIKAFNDLVDWGFFCLHEKSKNQYSANVIAIVKNTKAHTKALAKASQKHIQKQSNSIVGINKLLTIEQEKLGNDSNGNQKEKYNEYITHIKSQSVIERLCMNALINITPNHAPLLMQEFIETCYGDILEKSNKFQVEQYFMNWVKKEGRVNQAINNQIKKGRK